MDAKTSLYGACLHIACNARFAGGKCGNGHVSGHGLAGLHPFDQEQQMEQGPGLPGLPMPHLSGELLFVMSLPMTLKNVFKLLDSLQETPCNIHMAKSFHWYKATDKQSAALLPV